MESTSLLLILVAIIAAAVITQAVALTGAFLALRRIEDRFEEADRKLRALGPQLQKISRVVDNIAEFTDAAAEQVPRLAHDVEKAADTMRSAARIGGILLAQPLRPIAAAASLWRGFKEAARVYRDFRPARRPGLTLESAEYAPSER